MPEVSNEELGRRIFEMQKEKMVEETVEKIRLVLGPEWSAIPAPERKMVEHLLGEAWITMERDKWERCVFSRLTRDDLDRMVSIGKALDQKNIREESAVNEMMSVLSSTSD